MMTSGVARISEWWEGWREFEAEPSAAGDHWYLKVSPPAVAGGKRVWERSSQRWEIFVIFQ